MWYALAQEKDHAERGPGRVEQRIQPLDQLRCNLPGDVNLDGSFNVGDCYLLGQFLSCQIELTPLQITYSDMNADCLVDQVDLDYCIDYIFGGGPAPAPCACSEPSYDPCE
ncbi:MAG: hypothetical protein GY856_20870 [bacterium]|nr:hypothetical protein [bacterium]